MKSALNSSALVLVLAATTAAQTGVAPPQLTNQWGNGSNLLPFGQTLHRWQQLYESGALPPSLTIGKRINVIAWRRDIPTTAVFAPFTIDIEVGLYSVPFVQATMSPAFATNRTSGTGGIVFARKMVNLPAMALDVSPSQGNHMLPLDTPHLFMGPHLLAEVIAYDASVRQTNWRCDMCSGTTSGAATNFGTGCGPTANTIASTGTYLPGSPITLTEAGGPANTTVALGILGVNAVSAGGIPLPLSLAGLGAPGCWLRQSLDDIQVTTTSGGAASIVYPTPSDPALAGLSVSFQWANLDSSANALGASFSASRRVTFGPINCPMAYLYRLADNLDSTGSVFTNRGQVMTLVYQ
jgi:hypothetical protein